MDREELMHRLIEADKEIYSTFGLQHKVDVVIVGGSALILHGLLSRQTQDIDTINFIQAIEIIFNKYDINSRVLTFGDASAENYEDRLENLDLSTNSVNYRLLSLEDLVIMKLHSHRSKDYEDICSDEVLKALNWDKLEQIISSGETDVSFNQRKQDEFLGRYANYKKDHRKQ